MIPASTHTQAASMPRGIARFAALMIVFLFTVTAGVSTSFASTSWYSNFDSAVRSAKSSNKAVFLVIAREGCPACSQMERNLSQAGSRRALQGAVKVRVESSHNPGLSSRFAAAGTPTTVIFSPGNYQSPAYQYTGVMDTSTIRQIGRSIDSFN